MMSAPALTAPAREALQLQIHVDAALLDHVTAYILTEKRAELPSRNATRPERLRFRDMVAEAIVTLHLTVPGRTQTEVLQETVGLLTGVGIVQQWIDAPDDARIEEVIVREAPTAWRTCSWKSTARSSTWAMCARFRTLPR